MRVIIAGSRSISDYRAVEEAVAESEFEITTIISGRAPGVDRLGEEYAKNNDIPIEYYPAEWDKYGKSAGYKRNITMASNADALIAVMVAGGSKGTEHMIQEAFRKNLEVYVKTV